MIPTPALHTIVSVVVRAMCMAFMGVLSLSAFAQADCDESVRVYYDRIEFMNADGWDTLFFSEEERLIEDYVCQRIQLDGAGREELIISDSTEIHHSYGGSLGGGFLFARMHYSIWNLDSRKKIFDAVNLHRMWSLECESIRTDSLGEPEAVRCEISNCSYSYDITFDPSGQIVIENVLAEYDVHFERSDYTTGEETVEEYVDGRTPCEEFTPDHEAGIYAVKNGEVIKVE